MFKKKKITKTINTIKKYAHYYKNQELMLDYLKVNLSTIPKYN